MTGLLTRDAEPAVAVVKRRLLIVGAVLVLLVVLAVWVVAFSPILAARTIVIRGNHQLSTSAVRAAARVPRTALIRQGYRRLHLLAWGVSPDRQVRVAVPHSLRRAGGPASLRRPIRFGRPGRGSSGGGRRGFPAGVRTEFVEHNHGELAVGHHPRPARRADCRLGKCRAQRRESPAGGRAVKTAGQILRRDESAVRRRPLTSASAVTAGIDRRRPRVARRACLKRRAAELPSR